MYITFHVCNLCFFLNYLFYFLFSNCTSWKELSSFFVCFLFVCVCVCTLHLGRLKNPCLHLSFNTMNIAFCVCVCFMKIFYYTGKRVLMLGAKMLKSCKQLWKAVSVPIFLSCYLIFSFEILWSFSRIFYPVCFIDLDFDKIEFMSIELTARREEI